MHIMSIYLCLCGCIVCVPNHGMIRWDVKQKHHGNWVRWVLGKGPRPSLFYALDIHGAMRNLWLNFGFSAGESVQTNLKGNNLSRFYNSHWAGSTQNFPYSELRDHSFSIWALWNKMNSVPKMCFIQKLWTQCLVELKTSNRPGGSLWSYVMKIIWIYRK